MVLISNAASCARPELTVSFGTVMCGCFLTGFPHDFTFCSYGVI